MSTAVNLLIGFALNLASVLIIVRFIYFPGRRDRDYVFTFVIFNAIIFFVMGLMNNTGLSVGVGFGLFAIFSILRYRTDTVPIRDMTYLFVLIALAVVNSLLLQAQAFAEFAVVNIAIITLLYLLEKGWGFRYEIRKSITYDRIDLVRAENWPELMNDLKQRTGLPINRIEIGDLNFLRDSAHITIYCDASAIRASDVRLISGSLSNDD
ncbi:MAG: DUF4956 domain-containing protein [Anaerolineae bacterium]|nr:DUF4956 domain-containing protein [Anaerolineae bacterium]